MPQLADAERHLLIGGPYYPPRVRPGEFYPCEVHGLELVTDWTDAPLSWPIHRGGRGRGRSSLLVTPELVRALRTESVAAICYWWGVGKATVVRWKAHFGIGRSEGSSRLYEIIRDQVAHDDRILEWRRAHPPNADPERFDKLRRAAMQPKSPAHRQSLSAARKRVPPCPVCGKLMGSGHSLAHAARIERGEEYLHHCYVCGHNWPSRQQRPVRCPGCSAGDWDVLPCPVCGEMRTPEHVVEHLVSAGARIRGHKLSLPGKAGVWRRCEKCWRWIPAKMPAKEQGGSKASWCCQRCVGKKVFEI